MLPLHRTFSDVPPQGGDQAGPRPGGGPERCPWTGGPQHGISPASPTAVLQTQTGGRRLECLPRPTNSLISLRFPLPPPQLRPGRSLHGGVESKYRLSISSSHSNPGQWKSPLYWPHLTPILLPSDFSSRSFQPSVAPLFLPHL